MKFNNSKDKDSSNMKKFEDKNFRGKVFSKEKFLFGVGLVMMVFSSCISVFAASFLYNSNEVSFNNSSSPSISSNNVQGAIDELYSAASDYSALQSRVAALEDKWRIGTANESTSYFAGNWLVLKNIGTSTANRGLQIRDNSNGERGKLYYDPTDDVTRLVSNDSSSTFGQGKLTISGKPIMLSATNGGTGDINLNGNVKVNGTSLGDWIKVKNFENTTARNVAANGTGHIDFPIALSGYTPLGIVGITGSGTGNFALQDQYLTSTSNARVYFRNISGANATLNSLKIYVLFVKN